MRVYFILLICLLLGAINGYFTYKNRQDFIAVKCSEVAVNVEQTLMLALLGAVQIKDAEFDRRALFAATDAMRDKAFKQFGCRQDGK